MIFRPQLKALLLTLVVGLPFMSIAQNTPLMVNNGAMFYIGGNWNVGDTALVYVNGTVVNNEGTFINKGKLIVTPGNSSLGDFVNNDTAGSFFPVTINPEEGYFEIHGDWENNGTFICGKSKVKFPTTGLIEGTEVTRFHDVELVGPIVRSIYLNPIDSELPTIDVEIDETGTLDLDEGEFATNMNTLWVFNPATGAITRENCGDCGFVSSLGNPISGEAGSLARVVNQSTEYLFPTGSSLDIPADPTAHRRYRPVTVEPTTSAVDTFRARLVNRLATVDNLPIDQVDNSICYLNPWWYHQINKSPDGGVVSADIGIYSDLQEPAPFFSDENYNTIANWNATTGMWENMGNTLASLTAPYNAVIRYEWDDYQTYPEDAYILGFNVPEEPPVTGDDALCANVPVTYTVPDNGSTYEFTVTGGNVVDQTNTSITIIWENNTLDAVTGTIEVIETVPNNIPGNGGCASLTRVYPVEVWALPVANFTVGTDSTLPGGIFVYDILEMQDSSILTTEWSWDFGDGTTSTDSLPFHTYNEVGDYEITLIVTSGLDCQDTLIDTVSVVEGLIVPNVFTPNNDGWNDVFDVRTSNVGPFKIEIYNRWGNVVFETTSPQISWDGSTLAGVEASSGTYFYVISRAELESGNAIENNEDNFQFKETGWVQLIR